MTGWTLGSLPAKGRRLGQYGRAVGSDVASLRRQRDSSAETHLLLRRAHRWTGGRSSDVTLALLRRVTPEGAGLPPVHAEPRWTDLLAKLRADGLIEIPPILGRSAVARIEEFARTAPAHLTSTDGSRRHGTYAKRDDTTSMAFIVERFVLDNPDVQDLLASPDLLWLASQYFGMRPEVHLPILYWSCVKRSDAGPPIPTRQFHWDYDGVGCLRLHVNLTDVDQGAAPMQYIVGSHRPGSLRNGALRKGDRGVPDEVIWQAFGRDRMVTLTGQAGSMFVSDPRGLHRGTTPVTSDRLFMVIPFAATSFGAYQLRPRVVTPRSPAFRRVVAEGWPEFRLFHPDGRGWVDEHSGSQ